jgi:hypothetical protein
MIFFLPLPLFDRAVDWISRHCNMKLDTAQRTHIEVLWSTPEHTPLSNLSHDKACKPIIKLEISHVWDDGS